MNHPLVIPTLLYVGGILLGDHLPLALPWLFAAALAVGLVAVTGRRLQASWLGALLLLAGWTNQVYHTAILSPLDLRRTAGAQPILATLRGELLSTPTQRVYENEADGAAAWRTLALLQVTALQRQSAAWEPAAGVVAVMTPGLLPTNFFGGREVEITGVLQPPRPPMVPGQFDYRTYLRRQGIYHQLRTQGAPDWQFVPRAGPEPRPPVADRFSVWARRTLALGLPTEDEPLRLLWSMTLGWRANLTDEVYEPFMQSGTMHIFAISGLHIALIAGILVSLLRVLQVPRAGCGLVIVPVIWFYTGATGWQPSAIRSALMMSVIIAGWALRRPNNLVNSLAAAAFLILLWQPQQLFQASFQLSFLVVLSLALFTPPLTRLRERVFAPSEFVPLVLRPWWYRGARETGWWLWAFAATSLAAWIGSWPLCAHYFHLFSPITLPANLVAVPVSSAALACNLGALLSGGWFPGLAGLFNASAWFCMGLILRFSDWAVTLPGAFWNVRSPGLTGFAIYYGLLGAALLGRSFWGRHWRWGLAAVAASGMVLGAQAVARRSAGTLTVMPLNGGSAVWAQPAGGAEPVLVDCGDTNAFEFLVRRFLKAEGVNALPAFVLSHGDQKHVGAALELAGQWPPATVVTSPLGFRSPAYRRALTAWTSNGPPRRVVAAGQCFAGWTVLHPAAGDRFSVADDACLVLATEWFGVRILLLGDVGRAGQEALLRRRPDLRAEVVIACLPEKEEPLCPGLLASLGPQLVVLTDSEFPAHRRASPALRERLRRAGPEVICSRDVGAVRLELRTRGWRLCDAQGNLLLSSPSRRGPETGAAERPAQAGSRE